MKPIERQFGVKDLCPHCWDRGEGFTRQFNCQQAFTNTSSEAVTPCYLSDWQSCPHNKPEPVKEYIYWFRASTNGQWYVTTRWCKDADEFKKSFACGSEPIIYDRIDESERVRQ